MYVKKRRGLVAFAAIVASVALSGIGAGGAQAALTSHCAGANIEGQGSSLQGAAQDIWTGVVGAAGFNVNASGCNGALKPTVRYTRSSSGSCLNGWHADGTSTFNTTWAFCGTDDAPTALQITNINAAVGSGGSGSKVISVPVAQAAIAIVANPPASCTISDVTAANLEAAFRGSITTWSALGGTGAGCSGTINIVRRNDSSGTTYQLKHYLSTINGAAVNGTETWTDLQAAATNTTWPGTTTASQSGCLMASPCGGGVNSGSGGGDEVKTVGTVTGGLGYAALSDARSVVAGGTYASLKWVRVKRTATSTGVDPSSNGFVTTKASSNCATATGSYGTLPDTTTSWSGVYYTATTNYPICTLTWDLGLADYSQKFGAAGQDLATTVSDYLKYVTATAGGQADYASNDYAALPSDAQTSATAGITMVTD
jgi:ABC-type phosphate transport system substrate-binding protein